MAMLLRTQEVDAHAWKFADVNEVHAHGLPFLRRGVARIISWTLEV